MEEAADPAGPPARVAVVGLGLIGGSAAMRMRQVWPGTRIIGVDRETVGDAAARRGLIDDLCPEVSALPRCDLVLLAVPVPELLSLLAAWPDDPVHDLVSDTGSTKRRVVAAAARVPHFVGGHPIAGSARGGLAHASATLFQGRPWVVVEAPDSPKGSQVSARMAGVVEALGARPIRMTAEAHDRAMAYLSHVPQLLAVGLMNAAVDALGEAAREVSGRVFDEMTRVAASSGGLWQGILESNGDFVEEALETVTRCVPQPGRGPDDRMLLEAFALANRRRVDFEDD